MGEEKYVDMDTFGVVNYPDSIVTTGLGPCLGIGIFDMMLKRGYLMHSSCITIEDELLNKFISTVLHDSKPSDLEVLLTGVGVHVMKGEDVEELKRESEAQRRYIEEFVLSKLNGCNLRLKWPEVGCVIRLEVRTVTGEVNAFEVS